MVATDPTFLFGPSYCDSVGSPHGATVYLYAGGLFCHYELYERAPHEFYLERRSAISPDKCVADPRVRWNLEFDEPIVVGPDGERVVSGHAFEKAFDWGPH